MSRGEMRIQLNGFLILLDRGLQSIVVRLFAESVGGLESPKGLRGRGRRTQAVPGRDVRSNIQKRGSCLNRRGSKTGDPISRHWNQLRSQHFAGSEIDKFERQLETV